MELQSWLYLKDYHINDSVSLYMYMHLLVYTKHWYERASHGVYKC